MKIGVDLDGVVFDSEQMFRDCAYAFDKIIGGQGLLHPEEQMAGKRYGWDKEIIEKFLDKYLFYVIENAPLMPNAIEALNLLLNNGHELVIITSRSKDKEKEITKRRMEELGFSLPIIYTKEKLLACQTEGVDIMIDDSCKFVEEVADGGFTCIQLVPPDIKSVNKDNVFVCRNWEEIVTILLSLDKHFNVSLS